MPTSLPVPSKGALRALRNLALGTTCTIAFTTGVLIEDRRRRIHTAQKICDNGRKIRASRSYHGTGTAKTLEELFIKYEEGFRQARRPLSTGTVTTEILEERTMGYMDESFWQAGTPPLPAKSGARLNNKQGHVPAGPSTSLAPIFPAGQEPFPSYRMPKDGRFPFEPPTTISKSVPEALAQSLSKHNSWMASRQHKLAFDIGNLLEGGATPAIIDAAASRFFEAFDEGTLVDDSDICKQLIDAAAKLSKASIVQKKLSTAEKMLDIVLSYGEVDLEVFLSFNPEAIIKWLILGQPNQSPEIYKGNLRKACSIYLTKFKTKPHSIPSTLLSLGERLCKETCQHEMFDLTEGLYWRVERYSNETPLSLVKHLITAAHGAEQHTKVLRYFKRFYTQTSPSQLEFYTIVGLVMESIFASDRHGVSEKTLISATHMAQREGLSMSTTWYLKVLGHDWRSSRDIVRTRALFERLQPQLRLTRHPQAAYGAIIQFCIEAGNEPAAAMYYGILQKFHELTVADVRIHGHFTLAKAMRGDWSGVKEDLNNMRQLDPNLEEFSCSFTPILRLFSRSHDVKETESFLHLFIAQYDGLLTPYLSTIMINEYIKAGEFDSVSRWLDYMASVNCQVDSTFFSLILKDCYHKFKLSYEEVYQLYQSVAKLGMWTRRFINSDTLSALRQIAMADAGNNVAERVKRQQFLKLHVPIKRFNGGREILETMTAALAKGDASRVLKIYRQALDDQILLSESAVTIAIKAALELHPQNFDATACLLQDSQQNGQSVRHALSLIFIHMISELNSDRSTTSEAIRDMALSTISSLDQRGISVPPCVITHTMSLLVRRKRHQQTLDFWNSISHCHGHPLDLHTLTTLLQAYLGLRDPGGIEWAVEMLSKNTIAPDRRFQQILVKAYKDAKESMAPYFTQSVLKALNTVNEKRIDVTREKENAKMKILKIMENAILVDKAGEPALSDSLETMAEKLDVDLPSSIWLQTRWTLGGIPMKSQCVV
jgi:hypothetical protein